MAGVSRARIRIRQHTHTHASAYACRASAELAYAYVSYMMRSNMQWNITTPACCYSYYYTCMSRFMRSASDGSTCSTCRRISVSICTFVLVTQAKSVSICTLVLVKQVKCVLSGRWCRGRRGERCQYLYCCTSKQVKRESMPGGRWCRGRRGERCQYLYFCTSKASKAREYTQWEMVPGPPRSSMSVMCA